MSKEKARTITLELDPTVYSLLEVLTRGESAPVDSVEGVIYKLIDHAQQGVHRPGAWEREWLTQAFGDDWMIEQLEPGDPYGRPATRNEYFYCNDCHRTHDAERETIPQACIDKNDERQKDWSIRRLVREMLRNVGHANGALLHANGSALGNTRHFAKDELDPKNWTRTSGGKPLS